MKIYIQRIKNFHTKPCVFTAPEGVACWKQRVLRAPKHLLSETKGGLNILTDIYRTRERERTKGTEKVCDVGTGSNG